MKDVMIGKSSVVGLLAGFALLFASCADPEDRVYDGQESLALRAWMEKYHGMDGDMVVGNYQTDGDYYVDIIDPGDDRKPVNDTVYWVRVEFTGRDLAGNVCLTRDETIARQMGSFTKYTHYVPFFRYCGAETSGLMDGMHRALRNPLTLGADYAARKGLPEEVTLGLGAEVVLYLTSTVVGGGLSGSGGYEGQDYGGNTYSLNANRPLIARMKVLELVKNPLEYEGGEVDLFAEQNGGLKPVEKKEEGSASAVRGADEPQYDDGYAWRNAVDTLPQLYINHTFRPSVDPEALFKYRSAYRSSVAPYNDMEKLDREINQALIDRFGTGRLDGDKVEMTETAKVWYIGRFLDGFIFDTNIDEVKRIVYGKAESEGEALSIKPEAALSQYVSAWYYAIPQLRYGQWAAFVGTSTYNYGSSGKAGATTTTSTSSGYSDSAYYDMLNYYNYMNAYYGNSYYGGYYNNYYDNYYYGYYNNYYYDTSNTTTTTTTTVSTEIQSYTPLIFQIYIEEKEEK